MLLGIVLPAINYDSRQLEVKASKLYISLTLYSCNSPFNFLKIQLSYKKSCWSQVAFLDIHPEYKTGYQQVF